MTWLLVEVLAFASITVALIIITNPIAEAVNIKEVSEEIEEVISYTQFLKILDHYSFTIPEQVILCLHYLGQRKADISLSKLYRDIRPSEDGGETFSIEVCVEMLCANPNRAFYYIVQEVERATEDGSFTNTLDVVDDIIQSALPNYVMRFDEPQY